MADFDEYCFLYREAWSGPAVRWLLSVVPTAMIFDDHDVHDDWNTSAAWRRDFLAKPWWRDRIDGAYMSYWIYQHLGNLTPEDLAKDELWRTVREAGHDVAALLRDYAQRADESPEGIQWSFRRTFGRVRLVVIDSRSGRVLDDGHGQPRVSGPARREDGRELRQMVSDTEWEWVTESVAGDWDHVVLASSLPVLLSRGIHDLEAWNEAVAAGAWGASVHPGGRGDPPGRGPGALGGVRPLVHRVRAADHRAGYRDAGPRARLGHPARRRRPPQLPGRSRPARRDQLGDLGLPAGLLTHPQPAAEQLPPAAAHRHLACRRGHRRHAGPPGPGAARPS